MSTSITPNASADRTLEVLLGKFQDLADQWRVRGGGMSSTAGAVSVVHAGEVSALISQLRAQAVGSQAS